jgi:hypothetical protein
MQPSVLFRALLNVGSVSLTAAMLLGSAPASALTINLPTDVTCTWSDLTKVLNCTSTSQPPSNPGGPTNCSLSASPSSLTAAGPVSLTVSCQGTVTGYQWSASPSVAFNSGANTTTNTNSATINGNTTFTVTASNDSGSAQAVRSVQVGAATGGIACSGFNKTVVVNWDWNSNNLNTVDTYASASTSIGTNGILVIPFTPTLPANDAVAQLSITQYPGTQMVNSKRVAISTQPCDLNPSAAMSTAQGTTPKLFYVVGTAPVSNLTGQPQAASLQPGVQYYINVAERNYITALNPQGTQTCVPGGSFYPACELRIQVQKPSGH